MFDTLANWNELIRGANGWVRGCHGGFDGICHTFANEYSQGEEEGEGGQGGDALMIFVTLVAATFQPHQSGLPSHQLSFYITNTKHSMKLQCSQYKKNWTKNQQIGKQSSKCYNYPPSRCI